jgi:HAE1 family hydrophobic/amphiphilic exporter-1
MPSFALRNQHFIIVIALAVTILGFTAYMRIREDVLPKLHISEVVVGTFYPGMSPEDIERNITTRYERFFTLGADIKRVESRSLYGVSIIKLTLRQGVNLEAATAQFATLAMADLGLMPPGTLPPTVLPFSSSSLPVVLLTEQGKFNQIKLEEQARYNVRNFLATVSGASVPMPFGGKFRQIMAYMDPHKLRAHNVSMMGVVSRINNSNVILGVGDAKIGDKDYFISSNVMVDSPKSLKEVPIKVGADHVPVLLKDVGHPKDSSAIQYNSVLINGKPAVYIPVFRQSGADTLSVIDGVRNMIPKITGLPKGMKLKAIFSQGAYVRDAIESLERETVMGSLLATLMILLFLGSFRSTVGIFLSIPLSLLGAVFGLYISNQTLNIMTLGGFALAIGRLVDDSVVVLENINRHLEDGQAPRDAAREGGQEVALPVLASTITTIIVFAPVMFLYGVTKYLFSALALAVALAMVGSYLFAMSVIPIYCAHVLRPHERRGDGGEGQANDPEHNEHSAGQQSEDDEYEEGFFRARWNAIVAWPYWHRLEFLQRAFNRVGAWFGRFWEKFNACYERFVTWYEKKLNLALDRRYLVMGVIAFLFVASLGLYFELGTQLFPSTDSGKFEILVRAPNGMRIELTQEYARRIDDEIHKAIPKHDLEDVIANIGLPPSISAFYTSNSSEDTAEILVGLTRDHEKSMFFYMDLLQRKLSRKFPRLHFIYTSAGIVDQILNRGMPAPIDVALYGRMGYPFPKLFRQARALSNQIAALPEVRETFLPQIADYPSLRINFDRVRAARLGVNVRQAVDSVITGLISNEMIAPSIWIDPANGDDMYLTAQYHEGYINSFDSILDTPLYGLAVAEDRAHISFGLPVLPVRGSQHRQSVLLRDVASLVPEHHVAEADHYNVQRVIDIYVTPASEDYGGTEDAISRLVKHVKLPSGMHFQFRGSIVTMEKSFETMKSGMLLAAILLYLVLVAQFRSFLDPFIIMFAVPMGLSGVILMLWITGTTLNIESYMGVIVMIGIVVSNSILLVDFANERRRAGTPVRDSIVEAARIRMRPILMTALATIMALVPIALKLGTSSGTSTPLARAALGGLLVSTIFTLVLVPCIYETFYGRRRRKKPRPAH